MLFCPECGDPVYEYVSHELKDRSAKITRFECSGCRGMWVESRHHATGRVCIENAPVDV